MNTKNFIDHLFDAYEEDENLVDFKEELKGNLDEHIMSLQNRGMNKEEAFFMATGELGDISSLADEICLKKKREVFENMYMKTRNYISAKRLIVYLLCIGVFLFGIIVSFLSWMSSGMKEAGVATMMVFTIAPAGVATFLALTQETARNYPMRRKRALVYVLGVMLFLFGIFVFLITFFAQEAAPFAAAGTLIPFVLPSVLLLAFLVFTETNRNKPWVIDQQRKFQKQNEERFEDAAAEMKYGLLCGALWIFAIAVFVALGFLTGFRYSWITFLFAISAQLLVEYRFRGKPFA